jgi:hypothetical protein
MAHSSCDTVDLEIDKKLDGLDLHEKSGRMRCSFESNYSNSDCSLRIKAGADSDGWDSSDSSCSFFGPHDGFRYEADLSTLRSCCSPLPRSSDCAYMRL